MFPSFTILLIVLVASIIVYFYIKNRKEALYGLYGNVSEGNTTDRLEKEINIEEILAKDADEISEADTCFKELTRSKNAYNNKKKELVTKITELGDKRKIRKKECEDQRSQYNIKKLENDIQTIKNRLTKKV
jgi:peptidoglycan hydrolase CwlO-like protein